VKATVSRRFIVDGPLRVGRTAAIVVVLALSLLLSSGIVVGAAHPSPVAPATVHVPSPRAETAANLPVSIATLLHSTGPTPALAVPTWHNVTGTGANASPPGTYLGTFAYDPADQETVAFGGCSDFSCPQNLTWVFSNGVWTNVTDPHDAPPARIAAVMDYDANMHGVLLFGGVGDSGYLSDTWLFSGGHWTNLTYVGPAPSARVFAMFAFDPASDENGSVLWGGWDGSSALNDTWVWEGWSGWVRLVSSVVPPAADAVSMAYDPVDSVMLLFGAGFVNSTWELYAGQWWPVHIPAPPYRYEGGMVFDPAAGAVLLFGGDNDTLGYLNDAWTFAHGAWSSASFGTPPVARAGAGFSLDPSGSVPLLFGGSNDTTVLDDTWTIATDPTASLGASPSTAEVAQPVSFTVTVGTGTPPYDATLNFGDNSSVQLEGDGPTLEATHAFSAEGSYFPSVNVTDSAGLRVSASTVGEPMTVTAAPSISATASPSVVDLGTEVSFSAEAVVPGAAPSTYSWEFGDGATGSGASPSHAYAGTGTFRVNVTQTDAAGVEANASVSVEVEPLPTLTIGSNRTTTVVGAPVTFYANVSGGTAPYRFSWSFGDGTHSGFPSPFHVFSTAGTFTVQVWTNDSFSAPDHQSLSITVQASSPTNTTGAAGSSGAVPNWFYPGLGAVLAVGAVGAGLLLLRSRSRRSP